MNIISGSYPKRFESNINHKAYTEIHGYKYVFDNNNYKVESAYDHKEMSILNLPIDNEWWMWIDDDAFFMQMDTKVIDMPTDKLLLFPKSPVNPSGGWTFISAGNFFFKNNQVTHDFFNKVVNTDINLVKDWWTEDLGMFTNGDQDKIVYNLKETDMLNNTEIVGWELFNARPYHFKNVDDYFLVHFATPGISKEDSIANFQNKFGFKDSSLTR
jgi:hypothetical protein